jgi:hypothetical protein
MATQKLSQIASGGNLVPATDKLVAVRNGITDVLANASDLASALGVNPSLSLVGQRCGVNGQFANSGFLCSVSRQRILFPNGADAVQLVYPNFYMSTNGSGELGMKPWLYTATSAIYSGGTGYAVGDIDTFFGTNTTAITNANVRVMITQVAAGVPKQIQITDGGLFTTPVAAGTAPSITTGSGTGATATFTFNSSVFGGHIGLEPQWGQQVTSGTYALKAIAKGLTADVQLNRSIGVPINDFLTTDLIPVDIPVGGAAGIRFFGSVNSASIPYGRLPISSLYAPGAPSANYEYGSASTTFFDSSVSGVIGTSTFSNIIQPLLILGISKRPGPTVMCIGDSRTADTSTGTGSLSGNLDVSDGDGNISWFEKSLSSTTATAFWPWSNLSIGSDKIAPFFPASNPTFAKGGKGRYKAIAMARPTAVLMELAANDLAQGASLATLLAYEQQIIAELRGLGVRYVFTCTTDPWTTSTDSWATTGNQSLTAGSNNITSRNEDIRAGTWAPYDFFIDFSPVVESSLNSGLWAVTGVANANTGDGIHGSPAIITQKVLIAAPIMAANILL